MTTVLAPAPAAPSTEHGNARAMVGNANAAKSFIYAAEDKFPDDAPEIRGAVLSFREQLEATVIERHGELSLYHAAVVQTAVRLERANQLCLRWLRLNPELPISDRTQLLRDVKNASLARDACLKSIGLDKAAQVSFWDSFPAPQEAPTDTGE